MKINNVGYQNINQVSSNKITSETKIQEAPSEINGKVLSLDLSSKEISVENLKGQIFSGEFIGSDIVNIGENKNFLINKLGNKLYLFLDNKKGVSDKSSVSDILNEYGFNETEENINLIKHLIKEELPVTKENVFELNKALKLMGSDKIKEAVFLLKNNMPITKESSDLLDSFVQGKNNLIDNIKNLVDSLENLSDEGLKEKISNQINKNEFNFNKKNSNMFEVFKNTTNSLENKKEFFNQMIKNDLNFEELNNLLKGDNDISLDNKNLLASNLKNFSDAEKIVKEFILNKDVLIKDKANIDSFISKINIQDKDVENILKEELSKPIQFENKINKEINFEVLNKKINLTNSKPEDIDDVISNLKENISVIKDSIKGMTGNDFEKISSSTNKLSENLDFFLNTKNEVFFQMPININGTEKNSEIFVFKDKRKKNQLTGETSALVALDTISFGKFETYIQKKERSINLEFRLANKDIEKIVKSKIFELNDKLAELNYSVSTINFRMAKEPFTVIDREPSKSIDDSVKDFEIISFDKKA